MVARFWAHYPEEVRGSKPRSAKISFYFLYYFVTSEFACLGHFTMGKDRSDPSNDVLFSFNSGLSHPY